MKNFVAGLLILFPFAAFSQTISGTVKDEQGKSLAGASVSLKKTADSSIVKIAVTGNTGDYAFPEIAAGKYFINTSFVGFAAVNTPSFEHSGNATTAPAIVLFKINGDLKAVTVTATKPIVEVKADK